jgi:hypothetical protein
VAIFDPDPGAAPATLWTVRLRQRSSAQDGKKDAAQPPGKFIQARFVLRHLAAVVAATN